jgi:hypothetical protein
MTTWQSLLYCAAEVTLKRMGNQMAVTGTESLTVDFKEANTPAVAECAAATASHGHCRRTIPLSRVTYT